MISRPAAAGAAHDSQHQTGYVRHRPSFRRCSHDVPCGRFTPARASEPRPSFVPNRGALSRVSYAVSPGDGVRKSKLWQKLLDVEHVVLEDADVEEAPGGSEIAVI